jgi:hypothetical protein
MDIRQRSGKVNGHNILVEFLYILMRDHVVPGTIESILKDLEKHCDLEKEFSNGWLANYAKDIASRLDYRGSNANLS